MNRPRVSTMLNNALRILKILSLKTKITEKGSSLQHIDFEPLLPHEEHQCRCQWHGDVSHWTRNLQPLAQENQVEDNWISDLDINSLTANGTDITTFRILTMGDGESGTVVLTVCFRRSSHFLRRCNADDLQKSMDLSPCIEPLGRSPALLVV